MDLKELLAGLKDCPCGRKHDFDTELVEIGSGIVHKTGEYLDAVGFPKKILVVADKNTLGASAGILESLEKSGFKFKLKLYDNCIRADIEQVEELQKESTDVSGILAVGTGSIGDLCRVTAYRLNLELAIFGTAPSMDGFASDTAPIIENDFKRPGF